MPTPSSPTSHAAGLRAPAWNRDWVWGLLLFLAAVIAYYPAWHAGFIWDDDQHLTQNPCIVGPLGFSAIWTSSSAVYYPLVLTSFWFQHALWGLNPHPYHLVTIAMHAACATLLWRALLSLNARGAWLGAALWALHPVMVESVAWITELKNTQSCFFYLLAVLFFLRWWKLNGVSGKSADGASYALALFCAALAILSKSSTVMLPVVLGLCAWWMEGRWQWRAALRLAPFLFISLAAGAWTIWEQKFHSGAQGRDWAQSPPERIVIAGRAVWFYLGKLAWPHPLVFIYPRWKPDPSQPLAWLPALAVAVALFLLWRGRNGRMRPVFFAAAYFVVSLFPVLGFFNVYFFRYSFVADHFQYLAAIGPLALAGAGIASLPRFFKKKIPGMFPVACAVLLVTFAMFTWRQSRNYRDLETLWRSIIAVNPDCSLATNNLGMMLDQGGNPDGAMAYYKKSLDADPDFYEAHNNLGVVLRRKGLPAEAIAEYRKALDIWPGYHDAHNNLANILLEQGRVEEAMFHYRKAIEADPGDPECYCGLGNALLRQGKPDAAIPLFEAALAVNPDYADAHSRLGNVFFQQWRVDEAIGHYEKALKIDPNSAGGHYNLGNAYLQKGRTQEAIAEYRRALELSPGFADAHDNLGIALLQGGRAREAIPHFQASLKIDPSDVNAQVNLAWILATIPVDSLRDGPRALELAQKANRLASENPLILRALAAAYAETGRFEEARQTAQHAMDLATSKNSVALAETLRTQLKSYQANTPFRDPNLTEIPPVKP